MDIFVFFASGNTKPLYFLRVFWIFHKNPKKSMETQCFSITETLKTIVFPLIFLDFYEKSKKTLGNTLVFVLPDAKNTNMSIVFFSILKKKPKKTMEIQTSKNPKLSEIFLKVLDFWIFGFFIFGCL